MEYLVDSHIMKSVDNYSIQQAGIPSVVLMERAALGVSAFLSNLIADNKGVKPVKVVCICGNGNNGADGIATARQLNEAGINVNVILSGKSEGTNEYALQKTIINKLGIKCEEYDGRMDFSEYDYIVDALFGIGLSRIVEGKYAQIISAINESRKSGTRIISIDIPSGICADNGHVSGCAVMADYTVTFGYNKLGIMFYPGASYSGSVKVVNAGFAPQDNLLNNVKDFGNIYTFTDEDIRRLINRKNDSNKGTYGKALVIAGSETIGGAAVLSAGAAYRSGAGLVKLYTHENNRIPAMCSVPECLISTYSDTLDVEALESAMQWAGCIAAGPGLSMNRDARAITRKVLEITDKVRVLDADALNIIADENIDFHGKESGVIIVTPHIMEMSRLTGMTISQIKDDPVTCAKEYARRHQCICVLKDARTIVTDGKKLYINCTGNNGMSTGGSGDVLTGLVTGFAVQGIDAMQAACLAVYVHGKAGDCAAEKKGCEAMLASDISDAVSDALKSQDK